ncbi:MAG: hypothetical protein U0670_02910 [Anaerolineae bacterium]
MFRKAALVFTLLIVAFAAMPAFAYPPCSDYESPTPTLGHFCRPALVVANSRLLLRRGVENAVIYVLPSYTSRVIETVTRTGGVDLIAVSGPVWNDDAWWWEVTSVGLGSTGYTEQANVKELPIAADAPIPTITDASVQLENDWILPFEATLDDGTPFAWVRQGGSLDDIVYTLNPGAVFTVQPYDFYDGFQWWWSVEIGTPYGIVTGMLEQGSIRPLNDELSTVG